MKLKLFPKNLRESVHNKLNQNLVIESVLEIGFEAALSSKTNVLIVPEENLSVFETF